MAPRRMRRARRRPLIARNRFRRRVRRVRRGRVVTARQRLNFAADRQIVKFKYTDTRNLSALAAITTHEFRLNSLYDVDFTGGGAPVPGYATWSAIYQYYRVFAARWKVQGAVSSATNAAMVLVVNPTPTPVAGGYSTIREALGQSRAKSSTLAALSSQASFLTGRINLAALSGMTSAQYRASDDTASIYNNNPANSNLLQLTLGSIDGATAVSCAVIIEITLYAELFDRLPAV